MTPKPVGRTTSLAEAAAQLGVSQAEIERVVAKLFPDFATRVGHKLTSKEIEEVTKQVAPEKPK